MAQLVEFLCTKDGWQKAVENPKGFAVCPTCNNVLALGAYIEIPSNEKKYREISTKTFDIIREKHKELWERNRHYVILPTDNTEEIEIVPFQGNGRVEKEEYERYVRLMREIYLNLKMTYKK